MSSSPQRSLPAARGDTWRRWRCLGVWCFFLPVGQDQQTSMSAAGFLAPRYQEPPPPFLSHAAVLSKEENGRIMDLCTPPERLSLWLSKCRHLYGKPLNHAVAGFRFLPSALPPLVALAGSVPGDVGQTCLTARPPAGHDSQRWTTDAPASARIGGVSRQGWSSWSVQRVRAATTSKPAVPPDLPGARGRRGFNSELVGSLDPDAWSFGGGCLGCGGHWREDKAGVEGSPRRDWPPPAISACRFFDSVIITSAVTYNHRSTDQPHTHEPWTRRCARECAELRAAPTRPTPV